MIALLANYVIRFLQLYVISIARDTLCFYNIVSYSVHWIWKHFQSFNLISELWCALMIEKKITVMKIKMMMTNSQIFLIN